MNFKEILHKFRTEPFTGKEVGTKFERLMCSWLLTAPRYNGLEHAWLWEESPERKDFGGMDTGIDLVAKTIIGDYWVIQYKCYATDEIDEVFGIIDDDEEDDEAEGSQDEFDDIPLYDEIELDAIDNVIDKLAVDLFLAIFSRTFTNEVTFQTIHFSNCVWISNTAHRESNAEKAIHNQELPVTHIGMAELEASLVDWQKLMNGLTRNAALVEDKEQQTRALVSSQPLTGGHHTVLQDGGYCLCYPDIF